MTEEEDTIKKKTHRRFTLRRGFVENESSRVPSFCVKTFEKTLHPRPGYLTTKAQEILSKDSKDRTLKELDFVEDEVRLIKFFKRFPYNLVRDLCRVLQFHEYSKHKLILREGHPSYSMYIIVTGVVKVYKTVKGENSGRRREVNVDELCEGMQFGVEDLLLESPRAACVRCKSPTQFLRLEKDHFDALLKDLLLRDEARITEKLTTCSTLLEFELDEESLAQVKKTAKLGKFPPHTIVLGGTSELPYFVHFIVQGECAIEQEVEFVVEHNLGYKRLIPVTAISDTDAEAVKIIKKKIEICRLAPGHYFGMGEDMRQRYVRSLTYLETLMIPRYILLEKNQRNFDKLREQMEQSFPSLQKILDKYLEVINWEKFKNKVASEVIRSHSTVMAADETKSSKPPFVQYF